MIGEFNGPYLYNKKIITDWESKVGGVYYCGYKTTENKLVILYVGKAFGEEGIRGRLLQHINNDSWPDVTHFGYETCSSEMESLEYEATEIKKWKPKYNIQGK